MIAPPPPVLELGRHRGVAAQTLHKARALVQRNKWPGRGEAGRGIDPSSSVTSEYATHLQFAKGSFGRDIYSMPRGVRR